jgi:hypothetical protein
MVERDDEARAVPWRAPGRDTSDDVAQANPARRPQISNLEAGRRRHRAQRDEHARPEGDDLFLQERTASPARSFGWRPGAVVSRATLHGLHVGDLVDGGADDLEDPGEVPTGAREDESSSREALAKRLAGGPPPVRSRRFADHHHRGGGPYLMYGFAEGVGAARRISASGL